MFSEPASRFVGCLLGGALGDALGYPIEFAKPGAAILALYGDTVPHELCFAGEEGGIVSDDTQMTLFTAEGLIRARRAGARDPTEFVLRAYQRWYTTQEMRRGAAPVARSGQGLLLAEARLQARRAPGNTCLSALAQTFMGRPAGTLDAPPNYSKGCGAIMRSAPFGLVAETRTDAFRQALDAALLTHGHPSGYLSAAYFASLIFDLVRGAPLDEALRLADAELARERDAEEVVSKLGEASRLSPNCAPTLEDVERLGGGWTGEEALAIALMCAAAAATSCERVPLALWRAVAHGGDSDSTGSLTGNLLGAIHGPACFPARWREQLEMRDLIERVAQDLWTAVASPAELDPVAYPAQR